MEQIPLLEEIAIVAVAAVLVAGLAGRIRLPGVAGLLLAGALIGPHALGLVSDTHAIEVLAEVGVVLLLFTIGLEFSLERLKHIFRMVALGGALQVGGTFGLVVAGAIAFGVSQSQAVFYGFAVALSSTAIVLRGLTERRELDAPHGRFIVGTLIFQDLLVVPMVLIVPLLGPGAEGSFADIGIALGKAIAVVVGVLGIARLLVPVVMKWVEASGSREIFLLAVLALCVGTAWLTSLAGLSLALGAFLGGVVVADGEYSHRAMGDMLPLRDVFVSIFFVSLGMFFDVKVLAEEPIFVALLLCGLILGKGAIATGAALIMRFPPRAAWLAGVGLAQFGEFGFVLVRLGTANDVVEPAAIAPLLTAGIISMFLTPLLLQTAPHITAGERLLAPLVKLLRARGIEDASSSGQHLQDHVVLIGYGVAGRLVAKTLNNIDIECVIMELNAENVRHGRKAGDSVFYADATSVEALGHAHVASARCVVVMINDPHATYRVVEAIHRVAPATPIVTRTHYLADRQKLLSMGSTHVVTEEVEGGLTVLVEVLRELDVPRNVIDTQIDCAREATETPAHPVHVPQNAWTETSALAGLKVESVLIVEGSEGAARTLRELHLRVKTGATIVAIQRGSTLHSSIDAEDALAVGDIAYLIGDPVAVQTATRLLGTVAEEGLSSGS